MHYTEDSISAYDKEWKLSAHSVSFVNSLNFPMYIKFVWPFDLVGQMVNLAGKCLLTGHYHKPCTIMSGLCKSGHIWNINITSPSFHIFKNPSIKLNVDFFFIHFIHISSISQILMDRESKIYRLIATTTINFR